MDGSAEVHLARRGPQVCRHERSHRLRDHRLRGHAQRAEFAEDGPGRGGWILALHFQLAHPADPVHLLCDQLADIGDVVEEAGFLAHD